MSVKASEWRGRTAIVQRREDGDPPEFGDRNDAGVDQARAQVGVALDQVDAALVVGNTEVDHVRAPAVTNRRNRTSAAGPSRDSTSQAVSGTTGAGTTSSLWCSRSSPAQAAWQGSSVSAAETSTSVSTWTATRSDVVGQHMGDQLAARAVDVERLTPTGRATADELLQRITCLGGQPGRDQLRGQLVNSHTAASRGGRQPGGQLVG